MDQLPDDAKCCARPVAPGRPRVRRKRGCMSVTISRCADKMN